jgi:hypothetical protein
VVAQGTNDDIEAANKSAAFRFTSWGLFDVMQQMTSLLHYAQ